MLGIDDWAWRKGQHYGTILCDLERGKVVDLWRIAVQKAPSAGCALTLDKSKQQGPCQPICSGNDERGAAGRAGCRPLASATQHVFLLTHLAPQDVSTTRYGI